MSTRPDSISRSSNTALELALSSYAPLSPESLALVRASAGEARVHAVGAEIDEYANAGEPHVRAVLVGCVAWIAHMADGRRQILSLALPGELLDSPAPPDLSVGHVAMIETRLADVTAVAAAATQAGAPADLALAWKRARDAADMRRVRHTLRLGRMSAYERAAHLLMELHERQQRVRMADERSMPLPLTQEMLADLLGLSAVHMNRTLQQLRRDGLIVYRAGRVLFPDRERLVRVVGAGRGVDAPASMDSRRY